MSAADVEALLWETRRLFRELAAAADAALQPLGIQASDRAFLEFLAREPAPIGIAELARRRAVSRQHVHQTLNRLARPEWVEKLADPADARSVLLRLSPQGRAFWEEVRALDKAFLQRLARRLPADDVQHATATLHRIRDLLGSTTP